MSGYLLIESRDPFDSNDVHDFFALASGLAKQDGAITLFLVQNGVLPARAGSGFAALSRLAQAGVEILADDFSLRERGISHNRLVSAVKPASIDIVIDRLGEGRKALWH
ncbi:MAG: DsrE family protein [Kiloniellales bacterium]|nr:DsrE family protein [Kiloniellales bacterium]